MKKSLLLISAVLMMLTPMFLNGCAQKTAQLEGADYYTAVPKVQHERRYPHGHMMQPALGEEQNCEFNQATETYFCQYDWSGYTAVPKAKHERRYPHGHMMQPAPGEEENCEFNQATETYFCQFDWFE